MKVKIEDGCIGCGVCVNTCPNVFKLNDEGLSEVYKQPTEEEYNEVQEACDNCPVSVINID